MQEFFLFLKKPVYNEDFKEFDLKVFMPLFFFYFILSFPIGVVLFFLSKILGFQSQISELTVNEKIVLGIILAPVFEELIFRLIYVFTRRNLIILISTASILIVTFILKGNLIKVIIFSLLFLFYLFAFVFFKKTKKYFVSYFKFWFYIIVLVFGGLHIFNFYGLTVTNIVYTPLFVLPQLILGAILGYIRITYGFMYSLLFHFIINTTLLL